MVDPGHVWGPQTSHWLSKQYRQNELAGWVEVPTGVDVRMTEDPRQM